jgi:Tol biopolymer transport system component
LIITQSQQARRISQVLIGGRDIETPELLFETDETLLEAPNWTLDGTALILNGDGLLWRLDLDDIAAGLKPITFEGLPLINNDHVLDPDGDHIYMSGMDWNIYRGALAGGAVTRVSPDDGFRHFLHGVSPAGDRLAYVEIEAIGHPGRLAVCSSDGGTPTLLTPAGPHIDGPEWTPDGKWIVYNSEEFTSEPGHAQIVRISDAGGAPELLVTSKTVDWFPHVAPDGKSASYLAYPVGTLGHPGDLDVVVHLVDVDDWSTSVRAYPVFGGQGTINVNSWSPDSDRFAFVAYADR